MAPQGTGHGAARDRARSRARSCSPPSACAACGSTRSTRSARVRAGALWADVTVPASAYGLAPLAGSSHDVGVVGYTLGGGLSWLARKHGFACDSVTAIELVTADGEHVRTDAEQRSRAVPRAARRRRELRRRDRDGVRALPGRGADRGRDGVAVGARRGDLQRLARVDEDRPGRGHLALPHPPGPAAARRPGAAARPRLVVVEAAILGDPELLAPLRALEPELDMFAPMPPAGLIEIHNDPKEPDRPASATTGCSPTLPTDAIDALVAAAGPGSDSPLVSVELRHLGGALPRRRRVLLFAIGVAVRRRGGDGDRRRPRPRDGGDGPCDAGRALLNFTDKPSRRTASSTATRCTGCARSRPGRRRRPVRRQPPAPLAARGRSRARRQAPLAIVGRLAGCTVSVFTMPMAPGRVTVTTIRVPALSRLRMKGFSERTPLTPAFDSVLRLQPCAQRTVTAAPAGMPLTDSTEKLVLRRLAR